VPNCVEEQLSHTSDGVCDRINVVRPWLSYNMVDVLNRLPIARVDTALQLRY
jgi:hypothetical protein